MKKKIIPKKYLSFGDGDGISKDGPDDHLIAGGGGEAPLVAVEPRGVRGEQRRDGYVRCLVRGSACRQGYISFFTYFYKCIYLDIKYIYHFYHLSFFRLIWNQK